MTSDRSASTPTAPILDLALLLGPATAETFVARDESLHVLAHACSDSGTFSVTNHGLAADVIDSLLSVTAEFFALPTAEKMKIRRGDGPGDRGYRHMAMANGLSHESFFWIDNLRPVEGHPELNPGINLWPENPSRFEPVVLGAAAPLAELSARVLRAVALSAGLAADALDFMNEVRTMQLHHYDPETGLPPHNDMATLTIIFADDEGLETQLADGRWAAVPSTRGSLSCMLGDLAMHMTNDRYRTAVHRVVPSARRRHSVVWEPGCHPSALVGPLAEFCASEPARYQRRPFIDIAREWLEAKQQEPSPY